MKKTSRTVAGIRNTTATMICHIVHLAFSFVCRTIFTQILGEEYLGINGLFSNILTILSFADLGLGVALVYRMYAPLNLSDYTTVKRYVRLYRTAYRLIALVLALCGLSLIPFLPFLVQAPDVKENIIVLYLLYLGQTLASYIWVYKKSVLIADQKNFIVNICTEIFNILMYMAQCVFLFLTHNFILYCLIHILFTLCGNLTCSLLAERLYPFLREIKDADPVSADEIKGLTADVKGLLLTKVAHTAFSGTDNLFISAFLGIRYVGIISQYTLILSTINNIMNQVIGSLTASIGNLVVQKNPGQAEGVLKKLFFLNTALYGWICLGLLILLPEFVTQIWLTEDYQITQMLLMLVITDLFLRSIHYPLYVTRTAMGLFTQYRFLFVFAAFLNIVLDFLFVHPLGMEGLYIATILCRGITYAADIRAVYHIAFRKSILDYLKLVMRWLAFLGVCGLLSQWAVRLTPLTGIFGFAVKMVLITLIYIVMTVTVFVRSEEFRYYLALSRKMFMKFIAGYRNKKGAQS